MLVYVIKDLSHVYLCVLFLNSAPLVMILYQRVMKTARRKAIRCSLCFQPSQQVYLYSSQSPALLPPVLSSIPAPLQSLKGRCDILHQYWDKIKRCKTAAGITEGQISLLSHKGSPNKSSLYILKKWDKSSFQLVNWVGELSYPPRLKTQLKKNALDISHKKMLGIPQPCKV